MHDADNGLVAAKFNTLNLFLFDNMTAGLGSLRNF
jgi:hypothetical protein